MDAAPAQGIVQQHAVGQRAVDERPLGHLYRILQANRTVELAGAQLHAGGAEVAGQPGLVEAHGVALGHQRHPPAAPVARLQVQPELGALQVQAAPPRVAVVVHVVDAQRLLQGVVGAAAVVVVVPGQVQAGVGAGAPVGGSGRQGEGQQEQRQQ